MTKSLPITNHTNYQFGLILICMYVCNYVVENYSSIGLRNWNLRSKLYLLRKYFLYQLFQGNFYNFLKVTIWTRQDINIFNDRLTVLQVWQRLWLKINDLNFYFLSVFFWKLDFHNFEFQLKHSNKLKFHFQSLHLIHFHVCSQDLKIIILSHKIWMNLL